MKGSRPWIVKEVIKAEKGTSDYRISGESFETRKEDIFKRLLGGAKSADCASLTDNRKWRETRGSG